MKFDADKVIEKGWLVDWVVFGIILPIAIWLTAMFFAGDWIANHIYVMEFWLLQMVLTILWLWEAKRPIILGKYYRQVMAERIKGINIREKLPVPRESI